MSYDQDYDLNNGLAAWVYEGAVFTDMLALHDAQRSVKLHDDDPLRRSEHEQSELCFDNEFAVMEEDDGDS